MDIKLITKSDLIKYIAFALAMILLISTVVLNVKNNNQSEEIEKLNSQLASGELVLSEMQSEKDAVEEEKNSLDQSYKDKLNDQKDTHESVVDELNKQIEELNKQLPTKKGDKETTTKKSKKEPAMPKPVPSKGKTVYLTFDDGPSQYTTEVLDILDKYGVKATFFVVNGKYNHIMKDIVDRGHQIGLHCYKHVYSEIYKSDEAYFEDLNKISDVVKKQTGVESKIIRFPGGGSNTISKKYSPGIMTRLSQSVVKKGYSYFDWNCTNGDADGANTVVKQVINCSQFPQSEKNIVVLMHDNKKITMESLPKIIEYYKACGMEFGVLTPSMEFKNHRVLN